MQALGEFEAGYRRKPLPLFLFNMAQAARHAGMTARAIDLYRQFIAAAPDAPQRAEAEQHLGALSPPTPAPPVEPPAPAPPATAATPPAASAIPTASAAPPEVTRPAPRRRSAARDSAGATPLGLGLAATTTGAILTGVGGAALADSNASYARFDAAHRAEPLAWSGVVVLAVGLTLCTSAAIRFALVARRAR